MARTKAIEDTPKKKRGAQGAGSIFYIESKKLWCSKLTMGVDENGKQKRKEFYGKTQKEVREKLTAARAEMDKGTYIEPCKMTLAEWMDIWLVEYKKRNVKPTHYYGLCSNTEKHIKPYLGEYKLKDLRSDMVQKFINSLNDKGLAPNTIRAIHTCLKCALEQAVMNDLIAKNPAKNVKKPSIEKPEIRVLTPEEQEVFISNAKEAENGDFFLFVLCTGMRLGEILALCWSDIDFEDDTFKISKSVMAVKEYYDEKSKWQEVVGTPKTKSSNRTIPLLPTAKELLLNRLEKQKVYKLTFGKAYQENDLIFCKPDGTPLSKSIIGSLFRNVAGAAGMFDLHIHCLRHTFATRGLESGIELKVMQELLGHASIKMTADTYTHVLPNKKKESIMKLENAIKI